MVPSCTTCYLANEFYVSNYLNLRAWIGAQYVKQVVLKSAIKTLLFRENFDFDLLFVFIYLDSNFILFIAQF